MSDQNIFGGGNPNSLYTPMSDVEQEVLSRLIESQDLRIHVLGWGVVYQPRATMGDLRLKLEFNLDFNRPSQPMPVWFFDLELRTGSGLLLSRQRQPSMYGGKPISVVAGMVLGMVWDIAIQDMDPKIVKELKPGAIGLTNRWTDRDTGDRTMLGNNAFTAEQKAALIRLREGEALARQDTQKKVAKAVADMKKATGG